MNNKPSGILLVDKPAGMTSHDVVDRIRRITGIRRIGHAGTLDPLAEGLLIILVGDTTKRQSEFMAGEKEYVTILRLGAVSDTDDAEGRIEMINSKAQIPNEIQTREILKGFIGNSGQVPPMYSAVKIGGVRAYQLARTGKTPELKARRVTIREIELIDYTWPNLKIRVVCSPGTYIRALGRDIGRKLGCGAYLKALTRTRSGEFRLEQTVQLQRLTTENWQARLVRD